jgi:TP901 family phage tail tape measure protein
MSITSNIRAGSAYVEVTADTGRLNKGLSQAQAQLRAFGQTCTNVGRDLLVLSGAMAAPFAMAVRSFANFDDTMRLAQAVTGSIGEAFESLTRTAQTLGRTTSFTAQQVAGAMVALGRMGLASSEIEASIGAVLNLSRATGTDLSESADIAANSLRIFGLSADRMASVSDVLTAAANGSAQTLTDLFDAMKMAGPQAKAAGEDITDTAAAIGVLANVGLKGSLAGTALRKSFSQFAKVKIQDKLASVGVRAVDAIGNLRKMADIVRDLAGAMNAMPTAQRIAFAEEIFDLRGSLAGLSLTGNVADLDNFLGKLRDVDGVAATTSQKMDAGLGGSFRLLKSAVEGAMNAVGAAVSDTLQPFTDRITSVINALTNWIERNAGLVTAFAATVAGAAALGAAILAVGLACKGVAAAAGLARGVLVSFGAVQRAVAGSGLARSLAVIAHSFADYRNQAIPAMVGTSRLLAALNLPIDRRALQIASSFVLMGNAEAAAAAKAVVATRFQAVAGALRSLSLSTLAATAATKAHTAASAASAAVARALAAARGLAASVTAALSLANAKAAATAAASTAANVALGLSAKAVAAGYLLAHTAASAFLALPISVVFLAIAGAVAFLVHGLSRSSRYTAQLSTDMEKLREAGDELRSSDQLRMQRLQQLAGKQSLTNAEMAEAERLAAALRGRYGDLGISIDRVAGKLDMAADAQGRFNEALRKATLAQLDAEIEEHRNNVRELEKENDSLVSSWSGAAWDYVTSGFDSDVVSDKVQKNYDRISVERKKLEALLLRRNAAAGGDAGALTGKTENEALQEAIQADSQAALATQSDAEQAAKRLAEIERKLRRENQTSLENEIEDIRDLRDEYKGLIETMLDYEYSRADADEAKIAQLEEKLARADEEAEARVEAARSKRQQELAKEVADLQGTFDEQAGDIERRREERRQDREIDETLKTDPGKAVSMIEDLLIHAQQAAAASRADFGAALADAQSDGEISDEERDRLRGLQNAFASAENLVDKYSEKLRGAREGAEEADGNSRDRIAGTFYAKAAEAMGGLDLQTRTAAATEKIADNTKKTNDLLRKGAGGLTFT